jgi:hypothetical protein
MSMVAKAARFARAAHAGQVDKAGRPYIGHPARVAARVAEAMDTQDPSYESAIAAAWLHDTVEDCDTTIEDIDAAFGTYVAYLVDALTKRPGEPNLDYYARVRAAGPVARRIKHCDIDDNSGPKRMGLLPQATQDRLTAKYAIARAEIGDVNLVAVAP